MLECVASAGVCSSRWNVSLMLEFISHAGMCR